MQVDVTVPLHEVTLERLREANEGVEGFAVLAPRNDGTAALVVEFTDMELEAVYEEELG